MKPEPDPQPEPESASEARARTLFLIDGANLAYRSFYAFIRAPLTSSRGLNTSAPFGFTQTLLKLIEQERPDAIAVVWDPGGPTERHARFADYKATRRAMPDELRESLPLVHQVVDGFRVPSIAIPGIEADDVIGSLARRAEREGMRVYVVSSDKDFLQLVSDRVRCYNLTRGFAELEVMGPGEVLAKWGVGPERMRDLLALSGDASDGVPGIGPKTAQALLAEHGSLDAIYQDLDRVKQKAAREKLRAHRADAELSRDLVTVRTDVEVPVDLAELAAKPPDLDRLRALFLELEFTNLIERLAGQAPKPAAAPLVHTIIDAGADGEVAALARELAGAERVAVHLLVDGPPDRGAIAGIAFATADRTTCLATADEGMPGTLFAAPALDGRALDRALAALRPWLEDAARPKLVHDSKVVWRALRAHGVELRGVALDTLLASYTIDPSLRGHDLEALAERSLGAALPPLPAPAKGKGGLAALGRAALAQLAAARAHAVLRLAPGLEDALRALDLDRVYRDVELPLVPLLGRMEEAGIRIDRERLARLGAELAGQLQALEGEIHAIAGERFHIDSPKQLSQVLFERLAIHKALKVRVKKTTTGYSTDQSVLESLAAHPIVAKLLDYRLLRKLKGTYVDLLPGLADGRGRVHTTFHQAVTATGRLSSSDPNLQNIPIRTEQGRRVRAAFVARDDDHALLSADYSQVELRILAHMSDDATLVEAFRRGEDVHRATAARVFGVAADAVTPELRARAKVVNFGIIYGMGPLRLGQETGMSTEEARRFIDHYFAELPGVKRYIDETVAEAERRGSVHTLLGRRRLLPELRSDSPRVRAQARSMAVNTPIQGSAADLIKVAMLAIDRALRARGSRAELLIQVHDELLFCVPRAELDSVRELVRREMEGVHPELRVPLRVDMGSGRTWLEAH
jgi:DNA polymerase-1